MRTIQTVAGPIDSGSLGFCHSHEHLYIAKSHSFDINPALRIDDHTKSLAELLDFQSVGGGAIVDAQPVGCGRDAGELGRLAKESGVFIVASTGFHKLQFYPDNHWVFAYSSDQLTRIFLSELQEGMYIRCDYAQPQLQCGCRAGVIKAALDCGKMDGAYQKLFFAAVEAAKQTGAALMVHIEKDSDPLELVNLFLRYNADLSKVIFCHMDRTEPNLNIHKELCNHGIYMEYDTICRSKYHSDAHEIQIIAEMVESGWGKQILLGLDTTRERLRRYGGVPGLTYLKNEFLNQLSKAGIHAGTIRGFFYDNPANVFSQMKK